MSTRALGGGYFVGRSEHDVAMVDGEPVHAISRGRLSISTEEIASAVPEWPALLPIKAGAVLMAAVPHFLRIDAFL